MRRISLPVMMTGTMMTIYGALPGPAFGQAGIPSFCRTKPEDCKGATPKPCHVKVQLSKVDRLCKVTKLDTLEQAAMSRHQVALCSKDTVEWEFINGCGVDLELGIGNFRQDEEIVRRLIREDTTRKLTEEGLITQDRNDGDGPFDCVRTVPVGGGKSGSVKCRVKPGAHTPRTYKYDILRLGRGGRFVLLDPEGEIYH